MVRRLQYTLWSFEPDRIHCQFCCYDREKGTDSIAPPLLSNYPILVIKCCYKKFVADILHLGTFIDQPSLQCTMFMAQKSEHNKSGMWNNKNRNGSLQNTRYENHTTSHSSIVLCWLEDEPLELWHWLVQRNRLRNTHCTSLPDTNPRLTYSSFRNVFSSLMWLFLCPVFSLLTLFDSI